MDFDFATSATLMVPIILVVFGVILIFSAVKAIETFVINYGMRRDLY